MPKTGTNNDTVADLDRLQAQSADTVRRAAGRVRDLGETYRGRFREQLEEWMRLRARIDTPPKSDAADAPPAERLRARHDQLGRDLAALQLRLKRLDVAARQLELVVAYLASDDPSEVEPTLTDAQSMAAVPLRIIQAQEGERQRLAEEVHDGPAQVLTNAIFQVEYLDRVLDDSPSTAHAELAFMRTMLRDGLDEVRAFIAQLRPPAVDMGLAQAIADLAATLTARHELEISVSVDGIDGELAPDEKASVLRIVQEALQNVRKHSAATRVQIELENGSLVIGDNGRGFDVMRLASGARSFGLHFMRERAELMGSTLHVESRQGEGTRILLDLPSHH